MCTSRTSARSSAATRSRPCAAPATGFAPMKAVAELLGRVPIRGRLTFAFAALMIVLFGGLALLLHTRFAASLDVGIDRALHTRAADLTSLVGARDGGPLRPRTELPESGGAFAQILGPGSSVADSTPGHGLR